MDISIKINIDKLMDSIEEQTSVIAKRLKSEDGKSLYESVHLSKQDRASLMITIKDTLNVFYGRIANFNPVATFGESEITLSIDTPSRVYSNVSLQLETVIPAMLEMACLSAWCAKINLKHAESFHDMSMREIETAVNLIYRKKQPDPSEKVTSTIKR